MATRTHRFSVVLIMATFALAAFAAAAAFAQVGGIGGIGGGIGGIGGTGGTGVGGTVGSAGVVVDAEGVLRMKVFRDPNPQLAKQRLAAAMAGLDRGLAQPSKLRKISLNRLEKQLAERLAGNQAVPDDMRYLAGLTSVEFVFYYPDSRDIVLAGPAEGFMQDLSGRAVGIATGRAVLELQDLVVALRAFPPDGQGAPVISCSIDPRPEGLARMQQFLKNIAGRFRQGDAARVAAGLRESLGTQTVTLKGVSAATHFAQVLVEADYRMKLIGIGLERPPVRITAYVQRANPRDVARNALLRWYFMPNYECLRVSQDGLAMQLVGQGVKLVSEDEMVTATGGRQESRRSDRAGEAFVAEFTKMYPELANRSPVYAQLRNLIDLSIVAAYIQNADYYNQSGWALGVLGREAQFPVETYATPKQVESAVNVIWKGNTLMTPIGGGVNIQPRLALASDRLLRDGQEQLQQVRRQIDLQQLPAQSWWWD